MRHANRYVTRTTGTFLVTVAVLTAITALNRGVILSVQAWIELALTVLIAFVVGYLTGVTEGE